MGADAGDQANQRGRETDLGAKFARQFIRKPLEIRHRDPAKTNAQHRQQHEEWRQPTHQNAQDREDDAADRGFADGAVLELRLVFHVDVL